jgi:glc operon protein GlcG
LVNSNFRTEDGRILRGFNGAVCFALNIEREYTMKTKFLLEAADVQKVAAAAQAEALKNQWAVSIAIVDDGGHLLHFQRLDGAAAISSHIAPAKARTAALGRRESKVYEDIINGGRYSFLSAPELAGMLEGGVPILIDGQCVGAVGVSGVKSSEDAQIAKVAIAALSF